MYNEFNAETIHVLECLEQRKPIAFCAVVSLPAETVHPLDCLEYTKRVAYGEMIIQQMSILGQNMLFHISKIKAGRFWYSG